VLATKLTTELTMTAHRSESVEARKRDLEYPFPGLVIDVELPAPCLRLHRSRIAEALGLDRTVTLSALAAGWA